jgi:hypothetical protein
MSMLRRVSLSLVPAGCLAAFVGCYTVDFDESLSDVYYCQADSECASSQSCFQFRCVDDSGPRVTITGPEPLQNLAFGTATVTANYNIENFTISDSNAKVEGEGKVKVSIMGTEISTVSLIEAGAELDISSLPPGAYHLRVEAVYGDERPYENPSASAYTVFFIEDENPMRPQIALVSPPPGHVHIAGEELEIIVAVRNFTLQDMGTDCRIAEGCDPWGPDAASCIPVDCGVVPAGHPHVYILDNYPECLSASPTCNGDYVLSLRLIEAEGNVSTSSIPGDRFTEPGTYLFSTSIQYNDHLPYPNVEYAVYQQFEVTVRER